MKIAINGNRHQGGHISSILDMVSRFRAEGHRVVMSKHLYDYLTGVADIEPGLVEVVSLHTAPVGADLAISVGGDGAFLKTARWVGAMQIPIAGINTGHLGYLASFSFDNPAELCRLLTSGDYAISRRSVIRAEVLDANDPREYLALNEVAVTRGDTAPMLNIDAIIDHNARLTYTGDGLIISTPTGSTAYNLSVGGPILEPSLAGWVLSPIAAHSLSVRPLVVNDTAEITLQVRSRGSSYRLLVDGKIFALPTPTPLRVTRAPYDVKIVHLPGHSFADTLRSKLGWADR